MSLERITVGYAVCIVAGVVVGQSPGGMVDVVALDAVTVRIAEAHAHTAAASEKKVAAEPAVVQFLFGIQSAANTALKVGTDIGVGEQGKIQAGREIHPPYIVAVIRNPYMAAEFGKRREAV